MITLAWPKGLRQSSRVTRKMAFFSQPMQVTFTNDRKDIIFRSLAHGLSALPLHPDTFQRVAMMMAGQTLRFYD